MHDDLQRGVDVFDRHGVHRDKVREVLLQSALNEELQGCGERAAVGFEHQGQQTRTEIRAHHAFAG